MIRRLRSLDLRLLAKGQRQYEHQLARALGGDVPSLLDVGCGRWSPVAPLLPKISLSVGLDAVEPDGSLPSSQRHTQHVIGDVRQVGDLFAPKSFDVVVALDVIEHLPKPDGGAMLRAMEAIARRRVIVFTPNGFVPQDAYDGNPYQVHVSGWTAAEMQERGYAVIGINGWRRLRGERTAIVWHPRSFWYRVSVLTQHFFEKRPASAFQILCIKDLGP